MEAEERIRELAKFDTGDLQAEVARRVEEDRQARRDRQPRQFFRKGQTFSNERERAKHVAALPEDQLFEIKNDTIYLLDVENEAELATRLSRTAKTFYDYDHWRVVFYEHGSKVGDCGIDGESDSYAARWESRPPVDKWGYSHGLDPEWDLEEARDLLCHSSHPVTSYRY